MPDEYDSEEGGESSSSSEASSSSMSSMLVSPGGPEGKQQDYPMEEIDRIIREAKEQKRKLQGMAVESESSMSESGFDKRYLQKQSEMKQGQNNTKVNNRLVDEFLNDNQDLESSMESSLLTKHSLAISGHQSTSNFLM